MNIPKIEGNQNSGVNREILESISKSYWAYREEFERSKPEGYSNLVLCEEALKVSEILSVSPTVALNFIEEMRNLFFFGSQITFFSNEEDHTLDWRMDSQILPSGSIPCGFLETELGGSIRFSHSISDQKKWFHTMRAMASIGISKEAQVFVG